MEPVIGVKIPLMFANLIVMGFLFLFTFFTVSLVTEKLIPQFILAIKRLPAIYRYCFIPLTEEEVKDHGFTSARDYFFYVKEQVWYGKLEPADNVYRIINPCVLLTVEDTRKMLAVCIKVFGATSVFELQEKDLVILADDQRLDEFIKFIRGYHSMEDDVIDTSVVVRNDGRIKLRFQKEKSHTYKVII